MRTMMDIWRADDDTPPSRFRWVPVLVAVALLTVALLSGADLVRPYLAGGS